MDSKAKAIFAFILSIWLSSPLLAQDNVITWASNPKYPPYDWSIGTTDYDGACKRLLQLIIPEGYTLRPVVYPWARA